ncbi:a-gt.5 hypothetical protein [Yersinia phage phiR1-RT]|uniref:Uncharacterized protein n=3 Tax=Tegunavirus TaxID=1921704 RepID=A0A1V0DXG8_9CAUD|nr:a-gt.5 hypothetical protein [Yersinia phage phiR1-RT]YP_009200332.1 hypothetical protein AVV33_gp071 [Yersinia phage vB_YenM_TG1]YP_010089650.1 hypothetical protein KNT60_gp070 [Yersinia phage fHe-Yen9-01]AJD81888.1 hypothetical protein YenMTG1_071 [Yersinia phage vB_YenM_TG1]ARB05844.1 hypothetical protein fHeYen901_71 [Yersinia phage fHe-Yen9-01]CCI88641.1 a-gt.5 hypothetical protein [Yersinia phage phiR1-RT]
MSLKINLAGFLDEIDDVSSIPYLLKLYLLDVIKIPIKIDPLNPGDETITSDFGIVEYQYNVTDTEFSVSIDFKPFEEL